MIGATLGSYRITQRLSAGGMGEVFVAEHTLIGRKAAIKLLLPDVSQKPEIVDRFFNEAKATAAIGHPGIVEIFDFGFYDDGRAYLVMEFLQGESLRDRLRDKPKPPLDWSVAILVHVVNALSAAHKKGIVHRDLKPDNIFLVRDPAVLFGERTKLLDFGIAKLQDGGTSASKTRTGLIMGTPSYMAPEQCRGAGEVDQRADLYAIGCIFFELVCGRPPFVGEGAGEILGQHQFVDPPVPHTLVPDVDPAAERLILRLLAKKPQDRVASSEALLALLQGLGGGIKHRARKGRPGQLRPVTGQGYEHESEPVRRPAEQHGGEPATPLTQPLPAAPAMAPHMTPPPLSGAPHGTPLPQSPPVTPLGHTPAPHMQYTAPGAWTPQVSSTTLGSVASETLAPRPKNSRLWVIVASAMATLGFIGGGLMMTLGESPDRPESRAQQGAEQTIAASPVPEDGTGAMDAGKRQDVADSDPEPGSHAGTRGEVEPESDEPTGEPAAEAIATVALAIESTPPGATVRLQGMSTVLGQTPYIHEVEKEDEVLVFRVSLSGYDSQEVELSASEDGIVRVELQRSATKRQRRRRKPEDTKDPFGN